jgi:hypothetical protein
MNDNINMNSTITGSMNDNINMNSIITGSMNDNINMNSTITVPVPSQDLDLIFNVICCALCSMSSVNMRGDKIPKVLCTPRVTSHIRVPRDELSK